MSRMPTLSFLFSFSYTYLYLTTSTLTGNLIAVGSVYELVYCRYVWLASPGSSSLSVWHIITWAIFKFLNVFRKQHAEG